MTKEENIYGMIFSALTLRASQGKKTIGKYIADFYSAQAKLVIEIDGS